MSYATKNIKNAKRCIPAAIQLNLFIIIIDCDCCDWGKQSKILLRRLRTKTCQAKTDGYISCDFESLFVDIHSAHFKQLHFAYR